MLTYTLFLCTCVLGAASLRYQKRSFEDVRAKIDAIHATYAAALKARDKETILSLSHPDVRTLANNYPTLIGKDSLDPNMDWINMVGDVEVSTQELGPKDPNASFLYERTNIVIYNTDGDVMADLRRLIIWQKQDDSYLAYIVMSNVDHEIKRPSCSSDSFI